MTPDIAIVGSGAWGRALATIFASAGRPTVLVARNPASQAALANHAWPQGLTIAATPPAAAITLLCPPFQHLRETLSRLPETRGSLVLCCKGLETATALLGPEIIADCAITRPVAVLTGPNFAAEIARFQPAAAVLATTDPATRHHLIDTLATPTLRLYGSADITGAALAGAAKNVIAIAAGIVIGAGLGENARAALITRGLAEIARLATAIGGTPETIAGLAGLGDLVLTATGGASRNYRAGLAIGQNTHPDPTAGIIEGIATAPALLARAHSAGCDMPITASLVALLDNTTSVTETIATLMRRDLRDEV